jgi:hypothetical protein
MSFQASGYPTLLTRLSTLAVPSFNLQYSLSALTKSKHTLATSLHKPHHKLLPSMALLITSLLFNNTIRPALQQLRSQSRESAKDMMNSRMKTTKSMKPRRKPKAKRVPRQRRERTRTRTTETTSLAYVIK